MVGNSNYPVCDPERKQPSITSVNSNTRMTTTPSISKPQDLQRTINHVTADQFNAAYNHFGIDVSTEKTKILVQHASNRSQHIILTVKVNTHIVESVSSFSYLGSLLSSVATCEDEIQNSIRAVHGAYGRLTERVFQNHGLNF